MYFKLLLSILLFSSPSLASNINWFSSEELNQEVIASCSEIQEYINSFEPSENNIFNSWVIDLNNDSVMDYIVVAEVSGYCGSAGCTASAFLKEGASCKQVEMPHLSYDQEIGLKGVNVFLTRGQCGVWSLKGDKLVHIKNKKSCD